MLPGIPRQESSRPKSGIRPEAETPQTLCVRGMWEHNRGPCRPLLPHQRPSSTQQGHTKVLRQATVQIRKRYNSETAQFDFRVWTDIFFRVTLWTRGDKYGEENIIEEWMKRVRQITKKGSTHYYPRLHSLKILDSAMEYVHLCWDNLTKDEIEASELRVLWK